MDVLAHRQTYRQTDTDRHTQKQTTARKSSLLQKQMY